MPVRAPVFSGKFYPANPAQCGQMVLDYIEHASIPTDLNRTWIGGLLPHAGWICSGAIAGQTLAAMANQTRPEVVVVFGAVHTPAPLRAAALDANEEWDEPTGRSAVCQELRNHLLELNNNFLVDDRFHAQEHAIEVELPLIQHVWPEATILPVEIPADPLAPEIGRQTAAAIKALNLRPAFLASSDLTHYGPSYRFTPAGVGPAALNWAMDNDRRLLDLISNLADDRIVPEALSRYNACGAGAIAAMLSASREFGAETSRLLSHTNSFHTLATLAPQPPTNAVGYASLVVG